VRGHVDRLPAHGGHDVVDGPTLRLPFARGNEFGVEDLGDRVDLAALAAVVANRDGHLDRPLLRRRLGFEVGVSTRVIRPLRSRWKIPTDEGLLRL
jgi:hypothetical protein